MILRKAVLAILLVVGIFKFLPSTIGAVPWPTSTRNIARSFGEFMEGIDPKEPFNQKPFDYHQGIDIRGDSGSTIDCVENGTILKIFWVNDSSEKYLQYVIVEGESSRKYYYGHIDPNSDLNEGDPISVGDKIGTVAEWPACDFHHLHFQVLDSDDTLINPLMMLDQSDDTAPPIIGDFYICENMCEQSDQFIHKPLSGDWVISGDVDIMVEVSDKFSQGNDNIGIYRIEYAINEIAGNHDVPTTELYKFDKIPTGTSLLIFKNIPPCDTFSEYCDPKEFYYIVSNGRDGQIPSESLGFWDTDGLDESGKPKFPDGYYDITVTAYDAAGNKASKTEKVYVSNFFREGWERTEIGTFMPTNLIVADEGHWILSDTVSEFPEECGATPHTAEIADIDASKALRLTSNDSSSSCADNVWVLLTEVPEENLNLGFSIPIEIDTFISFEETGSLVEPQQHGWGQGCIFPPCFDNVSLQVVDDQGNVLTYVLQRYPNAVPDDSYATYREIFLDPNAKKYMRNLFSDFSTIAAFNPVDAEISSIGFKIHEHGIADIDNIYIGAQPPNGDIDNDGDIDGSDLVEFGSTGGEISIETFGTDFGRIYW